MKKLLMVVVLVVCAAVGSAQGVRRPGRTLERRLQRPVVSVARERQVAVTNGVEWMYRIATSYKNDGDIDRGVVLGGDSTPWRGTISKDVSGVLDIPDSIAGMPVVAIWEYAFHSCINLTLVTIPLSVKNIGDSAFANCTGLTSVTIPSSVKSIGRFAFSGCSGLTSVTIPSSVKSIGMSAFSDCSGLTMMMIPMGVTNIAACAFSGCNRISSFVVSSENQYFSSVNGLLCTKDGRRVIAGVNGNVMIPKCVTEIGEGAFSGCTSFVVSPENKHFSSVKGLLCTKDGKRVVVGVNGDVTIPKSVTEIGGNAFSDCRGLTSVIITPNVTNIGEMAFGPCDELVSVKFCGERPDCKEDVFFGCEKLKSIQVPVKCKSWAGMKEWQGRSLVFCGQNNAVQAERRDQVDVQSRNTSSRVGSMKNRRSSPVASAARDRQLHTITTKDFKAKLTGVAIIDGGRMCGFKEKADNADFLRPDRSIEIPYGKAACFRVEYGFPEGYQARVWTCDKNKNSYYLASNPSPLYNGEGVAYGLLRMRNTGRTYKLERLSISTDTEPTFEGHRFGWDLAEVSVNITFLGPEHTQDAKINEDVVKAKLTGISIIEGGRMCGFKTRAIKSKFQDPNTPIEIPYGKAACFRIEYDIAEGCQARVWARDEGSNSYYFACNPTTLCKGKGVEYGFLVMLSRGKNCTIEKLSIRTKAQLGAEEFPHMWNLAELPVRIKFLGPKAVTEKVNVDGYTWSYLTNGQEAVICAVLPKPTGDVAIPPILGGENVTRIDGTIFDGCKDLMSVKIPAGVVFDCDRFYGSRGLLEINVDVDNKWYASDDGVLYSKDMKKLIVCPKGKTKVTIPPCVTSIGRDAFGGCSRLTSVTIPSRVRSVGESAFSNCKGLKEVTILSNAKKVESHAFIDCKNLTSVMICGERPDSGEKVFCRCDNLKSIHVPVNAKSWAGMREWQGIPLIFDVEAKMAPEKISVAAELQSCDFLLNGQFKRNARVYLCLFSASWCGPCRREMPRIAKTYAETLKADPDIELIHFSCDQNDEKALAWAKECDVKFPVVKPKGGNPFDLHTRGIPHLFIVKDDGTLLEEGHPMRLFTDEKIRALKDR